MSDELNLPDDLRAIEARLAAKTPPVTSIDRDRLLYRAGFAAGVQSVQVAVANPPALAKRSRREVLWASATSAAIAAALVVAFTLIWRQDDAHDEVASAATSNAPAIVGHPVDDAQTLEPAVVLHLPAESDFVADAIDADQQTLSRPIFALRMRPGSFAAIDRPIFTADAAASAPAKTARQLLNELLPTAPSTNDRPAMFHAWPWSGASSEETI